MAMCTASTPDCMRMIQRSAKQHFNGMYGKPSKRHCRRRQADSNQALMDLGALICIPNGEPHCSVCPVAEFCRQRKQGTMQCYPVKKTKKERKLEQRTIFVIECQENI